MKKILPFLLLALAGCVETTAPSREITLSVPHQKQKWETPYGDGLALTSSHYRIFTTVTRPELLNSLPGFMEAAYQNYLSLTGLPGNSSHAMPVYMLANRPQWAALTQRLVKENLNLYLSIETGGYCYKGVCVFWDAGGIVTYAVASHEGMHQFLLSTVKDNLPMWVEEGLCTMAEGFNLQRSSVGFTASRNPLRMDSLRGAIVQNRQIELSRLLAMDAGDTVGGVTMDAAVEYYAQLWALMQFVQSRPQYRAGLVKMMEDAAAGRLQKKMNIDPDYYQQILRYNGKEYNRVMSEPIFEKYITQDQTTFQKDYIQYCHELTGLR